MYQDTQNLTPNKESRNVVLTVGLNFIISIAELLGGIFSNSLALISDALHNFSDGIALLIAYISIKISKKEANHQNTFGYKRIQILAALFNAIMLIGICIFLIYEAYERFLHPQEVHGLTMLIVASIGLVANIIGVLLLKKFSNKNLNIKAAYLHLMGDTLSSIAVIIGGVLIYFYQILWIDPIITLLIGLYIIYETWGVVSETYNILMQSVPHHLDLEEISNQVKQLEGIENVHHVHVWRLTDQEIHFEGHLELKQDIRVSETQKILESVKQLLFNQFDIKHVTLQPEYQHCNNGRLISGNKC